MRPVRAGLHDSVSDGIGTRLGASPSVGSSSRISLGRATRARGYYQHLLLAAAQAPRQLSARSSRTGKNASASLTPFASEFGLACAATRMFSSTLKEPKGRLSSGTYATPMRATRWAAMASTRCSSKRISPEVAGTRPIMVLSVVLFPRAVAPDEADDFACAHFEIHAVENVGAPVMDVKRRDFQHQSSPTSTAPK